MVSTSTTSERPPWNRHPACLSGSTVHSTLYLDAARALTSAGVQVLRLETSCYPPDTLASMIHSRIGALRAYRRASDPESPALLPRRPGDRDQERATRQDPNQGKPVDRPDYRGGGQRPEHRLGRRVCRRHSGSDWRLCPEWKMVSDTTGREPPENVQHAG
jgi:hypothetical protein